MSFLENQRWCLWIWSIYYFRCGGIMIYIKTTFSGYFQSSMIAFTTSCDKPNQCTHTTLCKWLSSIFNPLLWTNRTKFQRLITWWNKSPSLWIQLKRSTLKSIAANNCSILQNLLKIRTTFCWTCLNFRATESVFKDNTVFWCFIAWFSSETTSHPISTSYFCFLPVT